MHIYIHIYQAPSTWNTTQLKFFAMLAHICTYVYIVYTYMCICLCIFMCKYIYIYIYIYIHL